MKKHFQMFPQTNHDAHWAISSPKSYRTRNNSKCTIVINKQPRNLL